MDLAIARALMALSLGFHIVYASVGIALPLFMVIAEWRHLRTGEKEWLTLAKAWAKGTAILFAVGAVSGTALSFQLGLLWPGFMRHAGPIVGMPFSLEGFAFFTEAIFLGIVLYGWERVSPRAHVAAGVVVALSGALSAIFVVDANAWMNTPTGFRWTGTEAVDVDPIAAMLNPAATHEILHMLAAAYAAASFAGAGVHAWLLSRDPKSTLHRRALSVLLVVAGVSSIAIAATGHHAAQEVGRLTPVKLAAMEGHYRTSRDVPVLVGGFPDDARHETRWALRIPYGLSLLADNDPHAVVRGLDDFPDKPPTAVVHLAFDVMVGCGSAMLALSALVAFVAWRKRGVPDSKWMLRALVLASPLGFVALEAGWTVTEVGRQPWVVVGVLRTAQSVTPMPGLWVPLATFALLYALLTVAVVYLLRRQFVATLGAPGA